MANFQPWEYVGERIVKAANGTPRNPKKMTGTRLAAVLGLDKYKSPFGAWCEIMRVAERPFEGNKFTDAGQVIEPKLIEWCKTEVSPHILTPFEVFGKTTQEMGYDHFPNADILGGMWDGRAVDGKSNPLAVIEAKTSSRPQDWVEGVPNHYAIQGLLYGYLDGIDKVFFPVRFMEPNEYDDPSACECNDDNTVLYELNVQTSRVAGKLIEEHVADALEWYTEHVNGNVSPQFDEKIDAEYLAIMRRNEVKHDALEELARQAIVLETKIEVAKETAGLAAMEKELTALKKQMKPLFIDQFKANDEVVAAYGWKVKRSSKEVIDKQQMQDDGIYDKYLTTEDSYTMTKDKETTR